MLLMMSVMMIPRSSRVQVNFGWDTMWLNSCSFQRLDKYKVQEHWTAQRLGLALAQMKLVICELDRMRRIHEKNVKQHQSLGSRREAWFPFGQLQRPT